jgi:hypothetical protein
MSSVECSARSPRRVSPAFALLQGAVTSPRVLIYISCTLLALVSAYCMGKDMQWDTLDYHLYAGFSAIHDRFGLDYFAAAPQSYLNPYAYAPFYLLATSGLTALGVATILAVLQAPILWLTYELAIAIAPADRLPLRVAIGASAALLAFANPVLIQQFGSSYADITTGELALAGWLLMAGAIRQPGARRMAIAGFLLGAASALKMTNSPYALSLAIIPLFLPVKWSKRLRLACVYGGSVALTLVLVSAPWSWQLERLFGSPLFPLLNGVFRSPEYTSAPVADLRFVPTSLAEAAWRPFAMIAPVRMVHFEIPAPDLRYALLLVLGVGLILVQSWRRLRGARMGTGEPHTSDAGRMPLALGCAFLISWAIWLAESGNSRYFIPMASVASALIVYLTYRLCAGHPRVWAGAIAALLAVQVYQVQAGSEFRPQLPWGDEAWFDVSVPKPLASQPSLYLSVGIQSNSFVVPYLAPGSGFINIDGLYLLGPDDTNGARIRKLIERFSPHLRVLIGDTRVSADQETDVPHLDNVDDAVEPFGLRVDASRCTRIVARYAPKLQIITVARRLPTLPLSKWYTRYMVSCPLVQDPVHEDASIFKARAPNLALDRLEDACPALFQPRRPLTYVAGNAAHGYEWARQYANSNVLAWVYDGRVKYQELINHRPERDVGSVVAWGRAPLRIPCESRAGLH